MADLPSVEQCRTFLEVINRGRVAIDLEPLEALDFDACEPMSDTNCLSAHHMFYPAGYGIAYQYALPSSDADHRLAPAIGMEDGVIPDEIKVVTDAFDQVETGLRERMVEAGVVKP